jgi:hypothetical protein
MAEATPSARALAIAAATREARRRLLEYRQRRLEALEQLLDQVGQDLGRVFGQNTRGDGRVGIDALPLIEGYLQQRLRAFEAEWAVLFDESIRQAAAHGVDVAAVPAGGRVRAVDDVVQQLRAFRAADGLQLSDRLWRVGQQTETAITRAIRNAIVRGDSAEQAAQRFLREGQAVPAEISAARAGAQAGRLTRVLAKDVLTGQGSAAFNLERVLVTEMNRAFTEAFVGQLGQIQGVVGVRFTLSPLHPRLDVCDFYAKANLHGLGPGVYPLGRHPYPAHPMTLSYLQPVFDTDVSDADRQGRQSPFEWLRAQPGATQRGVLGSAEKHRAFVAGELLEEELRTPWRVVAQRLGRS